MLAISKFVGNAKIVYWVELGSKIQHFTSVALPTCRSRRPPKSICKNHCKEIPNPSQIAFKSVKKTTSQASCLASPSKTYFLIFCHLLAPQRVPESTKIYQKALTTIDGNHFWALRVAIYRCGALRARFATDLGRFWERFWWNLGPIWDNFWNIKPFKEQHHITWHTYIHTCIHFATTNRLGQAECTKRWINAFLS